MKSEEPTFWRGFSLARVRPPTASRPQDEARAIFCNSPSTSCFFPPACKSNVMSFYLQQPELYNEVILLSEAEKADPLAVIEAFFDDHKLYEIRDSLYWVANVCLSTDRYPFNKPEKRSDFIYNKEGIEKLFEALSLIIKTIPALRALLSAGDLAR
jgi:hypothetical protein